MSDPIPVLILSGHLGAGKTTVLNRLLATGGARVGVIINDFGSVNVDAGLVAGQVDEPVSISGGCLCCIDDPDQLESALRKLSAPALELDAVVIEGSGVAEPPVLIHMVLSSEVARVRFGGLVEVVDAAHVDRAEADGWDLRTHARAAAMVLLTKTDLPEGSAATGELRERLLAANPHVTIVEAPHGHVDPRLFFDAAERREPEDGQLALWEPGRAPGHDHDHHHDHHRSGTLDHAGTVAPAALAALLQDPPGGVYRIKGVVDVRTRSGLRRFTVHSVAGYVTVTRTPRASADDAHSTLVAIGLQLDEAEVTTLLGNLARDAGQAASSPRELQSLTRFMVS